MSETPINPDLEKIIRQSLSATKSWEWSDDDRKWSAAGSATKWLQANSTMSDALASAMALKITEELMKEEEPTMDERAAEAMHIFSQALTQEPQEDTGPAMRRCSACGQMHPVSAGEWYCPLDPKYRDGWSDKLADRGY